MILIYLPKVFWFFQGVHSFVSNCREVEYAPGGKLSRFFKIEGGAFIFFFFLGANEQVGKIEKKWVNTAVVF